MRKYCLSSYSLLAITALVALVLLPQISNAQRRIRFVVYQQSTNIGDCDGAFSGDSDPYWWFTGANISNECTGTTCNGCTTGTVLTLFDETFDCAFQVPASLVGVRFRGCENDGAGCAFGGFTGICDGGTADRTDNHPFVTTLGTTTVGPFCANGSCGAGGSTYCYWARWEVTGNFIGSPANDDICNAQPLTLGVVTNGNNTCATVQVGEPDPAAGNIMPSNTVWYSFVAPPSGHVVVSTDHGATNFDTEIAIYRANASPCPGNVWGNLTEVGSNDDITVVINERSEVDLQCLTPGMTYYVQMDGNDDSTFGPFQISVTAQGPPLPTNNNLCNAIGLTLGTTYSGNNNCATVQPGEPMGSCGQQFNTVWHTFVAPASGQVNVTTDFGGTNFDTQITVYQASSTPCPATNFGLMSELECNDDITFLINTRSQALVECMTPGATYYLQIGGAGSNDFGNYQVNVSSVGPPLPTHNNICNAIPLTLGVTGTYNNNCATVQPGEVDPASGTITPSNTVWHTFVAPPSGHVIVSTDHPGTSFDTEIAVYRASTSPCPGNVWGNLVEVGSSDDILLLINLRSEIDINCLTPGTTYYIQVDGNGAGDYGQYQINVVSTGPVQVNNDLICNAINLGTIGLAGTFTNNNQNNLCATISPGEPNFPGCLSGIDATIWVQFTTGPSLGYEMTISAGNDPLNLGDQIDLQLGLYTTSNGLCTGTLNAVDCDYTPGFFAEDLVVKCLLPSTTYWVQIDGSALNTRGFLGLTVTDDGRARAVNDLRCNATNLGTIPTLGSVSLPNENNYCGGVEPGEPVPLSFGLDQTVWYRFKPPVSGSVEIELIDNGTDLIDLQLAVWHSDDNTCTGFFSEEESYDDALSFSIDGPQALRLKCLDTSATYYIQVDGAYLPLLDNHVGDFQIIVRDYNVTAASNDSICNPIYLGNPSGAPVSYYYHNFCADNILEPIPTCFGTNMTVWYTFTAPPSGRVNIDLESDPLNVGDYIDLQVAVFALAGDVCTGAPTQVGCDYNDLLEFPPLSRSEEVDVNCLTPGRLYWIMVDGSDDPDEVDGFFRITVTENPGPGPITNDNICQATPLGTVPNVGSIVSTEQNNFCATVEPGEPTPAMSLIPFGLDQTVWYTFVAPASGNMTINAANDPFNRPDNIDLQLAVYESSNNTCTGTFSEVNSDYDPGFFSEDLGLTCLQPGRTYFLQVDGALLPPPPLPTVLVEGYFNLTLTADPAFVPMPTNDDICNAVNLGVVPSGLPTPVFNGSNYCTDTETGEPNVDTCPVSFQFSCDESVWFTFTTNNNPGAITVSLFNLNGIVPSINVYEAAVFPNCTFGNLSFIADQTGIPFTNLNLTIPCLTGNTTYFVQVDGVDFIGDEGAFSIQIADNAVPQVLPANDDICLATNLGTIALGGSSPVTPGTNICSTEEVAEPNVSGLPDRTDPLYDETVWYRFTTSATPGTINVNVTGVTGGLQTVLHIYRADAPPSCAFADLTEYDNATAPLPNNNLNMILDCLEPNTTYYIQLDGLDVIGDDGNFNIQIVDNGIPHLFPANDDICNSISLGVVPPGGNSANLAGHNYCATTEGGEPNVSGCSYLSDPLCDETVWYSFTTSATPGLTTVNITNAVGINASINVYLATPNPSCVFSNLILIEDADDLLSNDVSVDIPCLRPNTVYLVQVDGVDILGDEGTFNIFVHDNGAANTYPTNDNICAAQNLGNVPFGGATALTPGNNFCANTEFGEPNVDPCPVVSSLTCDETVWYRFTTSASPGAITVAIGNTVGINALINVYSVSPPGSCLFSSLTLVASRDDLLSNNVSITIPCLPGNQEYLVQVDGVDILGDNGTFTIQVSDNGTFVGAPANDNLCNAIAMGNPNNGSVGPLAGNNNCATQQSGEANVSGDDETVWYTFIAPNSGAATVNINSVSGIDANFTLYQSTGPCGFTNLQQVGNNHDNLISFSVSHTEECLVPGATYYIQIDGGDIFGDYGNFTVTVSDPHAGFVGPGNDPCNSSVVVPIGTEPCQGSGLWNVYNYGNPTVSLNSPFVQGCGGNCGDTWYSFVMPPSGTVLLEGNDEYGFLGLNNSQLTVAAYTGPCNNLSPINCDQGGVFDDPIYYITAAPGTVVYLQVFDDGGDDFNEEFALCLTDRCGSDDCSQAQPMQTGIWYCWDTDGATGESIPADPGYLECGDGTDPGHSVYFSYINACSSFTLSVRGNIGGQCILGEPTDGVSIAVFVDNTPCDGQPQAMLDCEQTDACLGTTYFFSHAYNLPIGTQLIIQIDGFDFTGNDNGQIRIDENCPLDVEYTNFTGYRENDVHNLRWTVTNENAYNGNFIVERSLTGQDFEAIGQVAGTEYLQDGGSSGGSATTVIDYGFTDLSPVPGHNYYRLRFIDQNGTETGSDMIDLYFEGQPLAQIMGLYPNPARDWVSLETFIPTAGTYEVSIVDLAGKVVISGDFDWEAGINRQRFELNAISAGMYIVRLKGKNDRSSDHRKFIKQ